MFSQVLPNNYIIFLLKYVKTARTEMVSVPKKKKHFEPSYGFCKNQSYQVGLIIFFIFMVSKKKYPHWLYLNVPRLIQCH